MSAAELRAVVNGALQVAMDWQGEVARLAALSPIVYDRERQPAAERLDCRVGTLDKAVAQVRSAGEEQAVSGQALDFRDPDPWPEQVNGAALLAEVDAAIRRHVVMADEARHAVALWAVFSYTLNSFSFAPRLLVKSPQRRCGKTTLLDALLELCRRPVPASNISAPALFRTIARGCPTVVLDEADTFMRQNEELRGLVNSGHRRSLAFVIRNVERNGDFEPRKFSTWCAMAIAGIGGQHATIEDRSIVVELRRKLTGEAVAPFDELARVELQLLARKVHRWALDHGERLNKAQPATPRGLNDRAADNWRPLLAIAEASEGGWPMLARAAATALSGESNKESRGELLLHDLRDIFDASDPLPDWLATEAILHRLNAMEERPWSELSRGKPMTAQGLRSMLDPFKVYSSHNAEKTKRGYRRGAFLDVWTRYLPPSAHDDAAIRPSVRKPAAARVSGEEASVRRQTGPDASQQGRNPPTARVPDGQTDALAPVDPMGLREWRV